MEIILFVVNKIEKNKVFKISFPKPQLGLDFCYLIFDVSQLFSGEIDFKQYATKKRLVYGIMVVELRCFIWPKQTMTQVVLPY